MQYQDAYLYLFNALTDIIGLVDSIDPSRELVDVAGLLRRAQAEAEEHCTR